ncbi:MAG: radical SAM protein [Bacillaceae bacterium]
MTKKEARFYEVSGKRIHCYLCPHNCKIPTGKVGKCGVREVGEDGKLYSLNYGQITSIALDPIEKKPLYYFEQGGLVLSIGSFGCNMGCLFCQNYTIAHERPDATYVSPEHMIEILETKAPESMGLAFTYNEPSIWFEYVYDTAKLLKERLPDKKVVIVSNGFISEEPLRELLPYVDAMNIDLKGDDEFYRKVCGARLEEVKRTIRITHEVGCHLEVTTLLIEGANTTYETISELGEFLASVSPDIPLHISRYFPAYKMTKPPTSLDEFKKVYKQLKEKLNVIHLGNLTLEEKRYVEGG